MEDLFGVLLFLLFFVVLPALDRRGRAKKKRAEAEEVPAPPPRPRKREAPTRRVETTFEQSRRAPARLQAPPEVEAPSAPAGFGELWAEIEKRSREGAQGGPEPEVFEERPAYHEAPETEERLVAPIPLPKAGAGQDSVLTPRRAAPPPLKAPKQRPHSSRRTHGHKGRRLIPEKLGIAELRRAVIYREVLGPPVSLRPSAAPIDDQG